MKLEELHNSCANGSHNASQTLWLLDLSITLLIIRIVCVCRLLMTLRY